MVIDHSSGDAESFPKTSLEIRAGIALERIGSWHWTRFGSGLLYALEDGFGGYLRGEWRPLYTEVEYTGEGWRVEAGLRTGWLFARPGRNGN